VLDEPNANLDEPGEQALEATIRQLRDEGSTVFLITHRPGILRVADHLVVMENGAVTLAGPREAVFERLRGAVLAPQSVPAATTRPAANGGNP